MPGPRIEQTRGRILQGLAKSIPAIMLESDAGVLPCSERHDSAEKQRCIFKGRGSRFPPANAAGYGSQLLGACFFGAHFWKRFSIEVI
jgi:hypothetical protein